MGEIAFQQMAQSGEPQSIVISGESGAGKTETNRLVVEHLVWRCGGGAAGGGGGAAAAAPLNAAFRRFVNVM